MSQYPYTVCTQCDWEQFYHRGCERTSQNWGASHTRETGHTTRMKRHHEFADVLWTKAFVANSYGETAEQMWLETLNASVRALVDDYINGSFSLEECEVFYASTPA